MDWNDLLPATECSYVLGNPPFVGKSLMSGEQKIDMQRTFGDMKRAGVLDYVAAWYLTAARYMEGTSIEVAFVSTNSISQGEQPRILWGALFHDFHLTINFAYQTFSWTSEARGKAHVHVVIVGFAQTAHTPRTLFVQGADAERYNPVTASNISPYLVEGADLTLPLRSRPLCAVPEAAWGNMPNDGGHLLLTTAEKKELLAAEPDARKYIKRFMGADELLNGGERWCIWLVNASPKDLKPLLLLRARIESVRAHRRNSKRTTTLALAATPSVFGEVRQPTTPYICIPLHSFETRTYIPCAYLPASVIVQNSCSAIADATSFHFGVIVSAMHMAWVKLVAGRLKSDFRYSSTLVYNNYPWPQNPTSTQNAKVEELAQAVLDARALYPDSTLAQLYDPLLMPAELVQAHQRLDRAVERCYRAQPFASDRERVEFLFALYEQLTAPLLPATHRASSAGGPRLNQSQRRAGLPIQQADHPKSCQPSNPVQNSSKPTKQQPKSNKITGRFTPSHPLH